jgi:glycine cleavage system H protein
MAQSDDLKYTADHEWVLVDASAGSESGGVATIGITDYAADKLGDVVFVDLPSVGSTVTGATVVGEIESTKSVGELITPVDGEVVEANDAVVADPSIVNSDPFGDGWLIKVAFTELPTLLTAVEYAALVAE